MTDGEDSLLKRLRESVRKVQQGPARATVAPPPAHQVTARDAVRQVARHRVSQILRQLRAASGLSYEQVKERTGLSQQLLFDVEYRERRLTLDELRLLADCYEVSVNDILGIDLEQ